MASKLDNQRQERRDHYQEVTDRIVAALEQGTAPWVCSWRSEGEGGRPRNGSSGHVYKGINVVLTAMSGFSSNRWYTFNQAQQLGGHVRRGEKGTQVVFWQFVDVKSADDQSADLGSDQGKTGRRIPILKCYTVFAAEQVAWPDASQHAIQAESGEADATLDGHHVAAQALVDASGADIRNGGNQAYYVPGEDYIRVPAFSRFELAGDYYATVMHELAHWTGNPSRLARNLTGRFGSEAYAMEELVAELASAFLCSQIGIAGKLQHAEYIASWIKVLQADKRAIFTASRMAQEAADHLSGRVGRLDAEDAAHGAPAALLEAA